MAYPEVAAIQLEKPCGGGGSKARVRREGEHGRHMGEGKLQCHTEKSKMVRGDASLAATNPVNSEHSSERGDLQ